MRMWRRLAREAAFRLGLGFDYSLGSLVESQLQTALNPEQGAVPLAGTDLEFGRKKICFRKQGRIHFRVRLRPEPRSSSQGLWPPSPRV